MNRETRATAFRAAAGLGVVRKRYELAALMFSYAHHLCEAMGGSNATLERSIIVAAARDVLAGMSTMGAANWHLRGALNERPPRRASPEVLTAPLRRYAAQYVRYVGEDNPKDAVYSLELYVVALEHLYRDSCGGGELHEALVRGLADTEAAE